jgi:biopolymer transport protein TolR
MECSHTQILRLGDDCDGFSTNGTSRGNGPSAAINVTPLIDVLLVMLIIFMVIVPVMPHGLNSVIPSTSPSTVMREAFDQPILVQIDMDGSLPRYRIDGAGVDQADVAQRLESLFARRSVRRLLVKADARLDFGVVAGVIDSGQGSGAEFVGLLTPAVEAHLK